MGDDGGRHASDGGASEHDDGGPGGAEAGDRARLIELLGRLAYRREDVVLSSGRRSGVYLDAKRVTYHPDGVGPVGRTVLERVRAHGAEAVGGPTLGADAIVTSTTWAANAARIALPGFIVRKGAKDHGLRKRIEGVHPAAGTRVAIVEDVVTSGGSVLDAVHVARELELDVAVVIALVDREEGGRAAIEAGGAAFDPVCTLAEVERAVR